MAAFDDMIFGPFLGFYESSSFPDDDDLEDMFEVFRLNAPPLA